MSVHRKLLMQLLPESTYFKWIQCIYEKTGFEYQDANTIISQVFKI